MSKLHLILACVLSLLVISAYTQEATRQERPDIQRSAPETTEEAPGTTGEASSKTVQGSGTTSKLKHFVFTEECFDKFLQGHFDLGCIKFTISKLLSYGIIAGSLLYKAPQIIKVLNSRSVEGLSLTSFYFQLLMVLITIGYNIHIKSPITTYAENISVLIQNSIIIFLCWKFDPKTSRVSVITSFIGFTALGVIMYLDVLPDKLYEGIGVINIVLFVLAVAPQIRMNFKNKSTGQLALITTLMAWGGNLARVFTTTQEVKDPLLLIFFIIGAILNGTVLLQILYYGEGKKEQKKQKMN